MYFCVIGGISFNFATAPLFFELAVELAYPSPEGVIAGFATCLLNFIGIIFLCIFLIPNIGKCYLYFNYLLVFLRFKKYMPQVKVFQFELSSGTTLVVVHHH